MAKRYSAAEDAFLERSVKESAIDGKINWEEVAKKISEKSGKTQKPGAVKTRYYRLMSQNGVEQGARSGDKTLKRVVKWMENLVASQHRMRAQLDVKKGKRHNSARMELLKKENEELRGEIKSLKKEIKSHGPILKWYIDAQKGFKIAKEKKALITE